MQTKQGQVDLRGPAAGVVRHTRRKERPAAAGEKAPACLLRRVLWLEPIWIGLLAPALLFPGRFWVAAWQPGLVLLLFVFWPLRFGTQQPLVVPRLLGMPALGLLAAVAWAMAVSPAPAASWEAAGYLLLGVALALALVQWPPVQKRPALVAWLLLAVGGAMAVAGPLLLGAMPAKFGLGALMPAAGRLGAALGETVNPNVLGGALVIPTLLAAALAIGPRSTQKPWRWVWALLALAFLAVLLLTQCRGAYLGAAVGAALLLSLRWPRLAWVTVPAGVAAATLLASGMGPALALDAMGAGKDQSGLSGRLAIWQFAGAVARHSPLHGAGLGLFAAVQPHAAGAAPAPHAHNLLLQVMMDLGVVGLAAYVAVLAGAAIMLVRLLRRRLPLQGRLRRGLPARSHPSLGYAGSSPLATPHQLTAAEVYRRRLHWTLAMGAAAALSSVLVHGLVDAAVWGNKMAFLPWMIFALVASLYQYAKEAL